MNADERSLAEEITEGFKVLETIRQLQDEVEALKQIIDANNLNQNIGQFVKPTNEPVAWIIESDEEFKNGKNYPTLDWYIKDILNLPIGTKLYTYPVEEQNESFDRTASHMAGEYVSYQKELTDAITLLEKYADKLEDERPNKGLSDVVLECVEILRKAQEK